MHKRNGVIYERLGTQKGVFRGQPHEDRMQQRSLTTEVLDRCYGLEFWGDGESELAELYRSRGYEVKRTEKGYLILADQEPRGILDVISPIVEAGFETRLPKVTLQLVVREP